MSPSGAEVLRQIKSRIEEIDPGAVREALEAGAVLIDVREAEEVAQGHIPGARHVPKSYLESRIEGAAPDRAGAVILYRRLPAVEGPRLRGRGPAGAECRAAGTLFPPSAAARGWD